MLALGETLRMVELFWKKQTGYNDMTLGRGTAQVSILAHFFSGRLPRRGRCTKRECECDYDGVQASREVAQRWK